MTDNVTLSWLDILLKATLKDSICILCNPYLGAGKVSDDVVSAGDWCCSAWLLTLPVSFPDLRAFSSSRVFSGARWESQA